MGICLLLGMALTSEGFSNMITLSKERFKEVLDESFNEGYAKAMETFLEAKAKGSSLGYLMTSRIKWFYDENLRMLKSENLEKDTINGGYFTITIDPYENCPTISNGASIVASGLNFPTKYLDTIEEAILGAEKFWAENRNTILSDKRSYEC